MQLVCSTTPFPKRLDTYRKNSSRTRKADASRDQYLHAVPVTATPHVLSMSVESRRMQLFSKSYASQRARADLEHFPGGSRCSRVLFVFLEPGCHRVYRTLQCSVNAYELVIEKVVQ